jgi:serine/threonine protein kinase/Flp pilus assembly protein TadD
MSEPSSNSSRLDHLAEEFVQRHHRGEHPSPTEYAQRYPELADEIRDLFPALLLMQEVRPEPGNATGPFEPYRPAEGHRPERLGDYRILREVGRGGMGIVYEAEQESLGRHVALKLLPAHALLEGQRLRRFLREARAAARLHHTNIVPVYGVGSNDGVHYYVMQFIQGLGLDAVLAELKELRQARTRDHLSGPADGRPNPASRSGQVTASHVAQALLTGDYRPGAVLEPPGDPLAGAAGSGNSTVHLPGQAAHSTLSESGQQYWQSVARIGVQVADALAYAHTQGTLHRDIKPSNLLLDTQGTVWVTDFGLAKATGSEDLTHTGDIVGTLRYMAPERFQGKSDARGDLYSLGLTLYELLTFQPAFDEADRGRLIHRVTHEEPVPPRRLNPEVPRDLETIVLKAIARDPAHRYQTASELAEDLKRFLDLKPIRARRVGVPERFWRWCRRNPVVASLLGLLVVVFLAGFAGVTWKWQEAEQLREDENSARAAADKARQAAVKSQRLADARAAKSRRELNALAKAYRLVSAGQVYQENGQWQKAEAALSRAVHLRPDLPNFRMARAELYTQFCLWDLAAADYARAYSLQEAMGSLAWYQHVILRLSTGDQAGYRRVCRRMAEVFQDTKDKDISHRIALAYLLVPRPVLKPQRLIRLAAARGPYSPHAYDHLTLAWAHYRAGHYDLAQRSTQKCAELFPNWCKLWRFSLQAMIQHRLGQAEAARQALGNATTELRRWITFLMKEKSGQLPDAWWDILVFPRFYAEAQKLIEGSTLPEDPRWWVIRGRSLATLGRTKQAAAQFARAVKAKPRDVSIRLAYFHFFVDQDRWDQAQGQLAAAARLKPDDANVWLNGFRAYAAKGRRARADAALARAARLKPDDGQVWLEGIRVYAGHGQWKAARAAHARAVFLRPDDASIRLHIVAYHANGEDWDKAEAEYARVAAQRPKDAQVRYLYANLLWRKQRDLPKAVAALTEATRLQPRYSFAWNLLGVCLFRQKEYRKAIAAYTHAHQLRPMDSVILGNRGSTYAELGQWQRAAKDYARASELQRNSPTFRRNYALCCLAAGRTKDYQRCCAQMLQEAKDSGLGALVGTASLLCTLAPDAVADPSRVLRLLRRWEKDNEKNAFYRSLLGFVNYRAGNYGEAVRQLQRAAAIRGNPEPVGEFFLALSYHWLGQADNARRTLRKGRHVQEKATGNKAAPTLTPPMGFPALDLLPAQLLRREAEAVLGAPHRREAEEHFRNKEWAKALPHLDKLIAADGKFWPDLMTRGTCYAELGELKKAHADFTKLVKLGTAPLRDNWVYWHHCLLCQEVGDDDGLRRNRRRLAKQYGDSKDASVLYPLTVPYRFPGPGVDRARVVRWTKRLVALAPTNVYYHHELAVALFRAGRYTEALARFRRVQTMGVPVNHVPFQDFYLALTYHHLGKAGLARKHLRRAVEWVERFAIPGRLPPEWGEQPFWGYFVEWKLLRREGEALLGPPTPSPVGKCLREWKWAEAAGHLDRRLAVNPRSKFDLQTRALCHIELRRWNRAAADFGKLAQLEPDRVEPLVHQSAALLAAGKRAAARRICNRMLERFGVRDRLSTWLIYSCVRTPDSVRDHAALLKMMRKVIQVDKGAKHLLGAVLYRAGRWGEVVRLLEEDSWYLEPRAWDLLFLAMAHQRLGHPRKARAYFDKARRWVAQAKGRPMGWGGGGWGWWGEPVEVESLTREAQALLKR